MVAHSIVQEGPAFACLSPCMFQYLSDEECYPELEDVPLNITTHKLITYIEEVIIVIIVTTKCNDLLSCIDTCCGTYTCPVE